MKNKIFTTVKGIPAYVKKHIQKFLVWKKDNLGIWILKVLIVIAAVLGIVLLYKFFLSIGSILFLLAILYSNSLENAVNKFGNIANSEIAPRMQNCLCSNALFSALKDNATIFNVIQPKMISEIFPDISQYANPQTIENLIFFRYPVKIHDENKEMDFQGLAATLNTIIAKKSQNGELENMPFPFYNEISSIQVLQISLDSFNPAFCAIDLMFIDNNAKYNFILKKLELQQKKEAYLAPPLDEDF